MQSLAYHSLLQQLYLQSMKTGNKLSIINTIFILSGAENVLCRDFKHHSNRAIETIVGKAYQVRD